MRFFSSPPPQLSPLPLPDSGFLSFHIFICRQRFPLASLPRFFSEACLLSSRFAVADGYALLRAPHQVFYTTTRGGI